MGLETVVQSERVDEHCRMNKQIGMTTRRETLIGGISLVAAASLPACALVQSDSMPLNPIHPRRGTSAMGTVTTKDGAEIFYKDWGSGQPVVFSHGWPLTSDAFEDQMFFLAQHGYRCIAADRRGHGRSTQTWHGNDLDTYADDLAEVVAKLDLRSVIHVGHSTGGGEVTRYIGRHGTQRVAKAVLISAIPPLMLKTAANPGGLPTARARFRSNGRQEPGPARKESNWR